MRSQFQQLIASVASFDGFLLLFFLFTRKKLLDIRGKLLGALEFFRRLKFGGIVPDLWKIISNFLPENAGVCMECNLFHTDLIFAILSSFLHRRLNGSFEIHLVYCVSLSPILMSPVGHLDGNFTSSHIARDSRRTETLKTDQRSTGN